MKDHPPDLPDAFLPLVAKCRMQGIPVLPGLVRHWCLSCVSALPLVSILHGAPAVPGPLADSESAVSVGTEPTSGDDDPANLSADQVTKRLANPNTPLASLTLRNQWIHWDGDLPGADGLDSGVVEFQPVFPFPLDERTTLSVRPSFSYLIDQPVFDPATGSVDTRSGFGDMGFDLACGRTSSSGVLSRFGISGSIPIGADGLSSDTWALGPETLVGVVKDYGVFGFFPSHLWNLGGPTTINRTTLQPLAVYLPGNAWAIGTSPIITYDWTGDQWSIPLQLGISKTVKIGDMPLRLGLEVNYFLEAPDGLGEEWMVAFNITPVLPNVFARLLKPEN